MNNNEQYNRLAKSTNIKTTSEPKPHVPQIKKTDIRRGYIVRSFVQKTNDNFSPVPDQI